MNSALPWYLNPVFLPPVFGLLGVLVGGLITFASSYFLDRSRAERERAQEERDRKREVKRAARLIGLELLWVRTAANRSVVQKKWPNPDVPLLTLSTEARQKYLDAIAPELSSNAWLTVTIGLQAADTFKMIAGKPRDLAVAVPDEVAKTFVPLVENIDKGRVELAPHELDSNAA
ncbi:MAG: hypothetical protein ACJ8NS_00130 [Chthoniobacterales bacterium]